MLPNSNFKGINLVNSNESGINFENSAINKIANNFHDPNIVRVLWTGGWDSTFRVLQLVIEKELTVLPIYLITTDRTSTDIEIRTINKIKKLTFETFPQTVGRILPTFFFSVNDLPQYPDIAAKHKALNEHSFLGSQYKPLASLARYFGLNDLELGVVQDGTVNKLVKDFVVKQEELQPGYYSLDPAMNNSNPVSLFKPFRFPIYAWSKVAMREHAVKTGTIEIMNLTWFCHRPRNGEPCGICNPCRHTIEDGMEFRFPKTSLARYRKNQLSRRIEKKYPVAFKFFDKVFGGFSKLITGKKTAGDVVSYLKKVTS